MTTSLRKSREDILEVTLALLWRQWTLLGVPGQLLEKAENSPSVIDPEALLLATSRLGRFDPRLLAEALNWLKAFGKFISIQRLKTLHQLNPHKEPRELAAIASTLQESSRQAKWRAIEDLATLSAGGESLYRSAEGTDFPRGGTPDPHFAKFGLFRAMPKGVSKFSKADLEASMARHIVQHPELFLIKLRALFGVNARAEIIAALLTRSSSHPAELALHIGYLARSIQDTLNEMTLSGLLASHRAAGSREKHFSLRPSDWTFLITWPEPRFPVWIDWAALYALLQDIIATLYSDEIREASPLMTALRLRQTFDRHQLALARSGLAAHFLKSAQTTGVDFVEALAAELHLF